MRYPELYDAAKNKDLVRFKTETPHSLVVDKFIDIRAKGYASTYDGLKN